MNLCGALLSTWIPVSCAKHSRSHSRWRPERIWDCKSWANNFRVPEGFFSIRSKYKQGLNNNDLQPDVAHTRGKNMIGPLLIFDKSLVEILNPVPV